MPPFNSLTVGTALPTRTYEATAVSLFLYNAVIWNAHRIHYDEPYTTAVEHHPGIVIDGPLQGDWLSQVALDWIGTDGELLEFEYSNRRASYLGQRLTAGGRIAALDPAARRVTLELAIRDDNDQITTPGRALVRLHR